MKVHQDMEKDMTEAMDKALLSVPKDKLAEASWFSRLEEKGISVETTQDIVDNAPDGATNYQFDNDQWIEGYLKHNLSTGELQYWSGLQWLPNAGCNPEYTVALPNYPEIE